MPRRLPLRRMIFGAGVVLALLGAQHFGLLPVGKGDSVAGTNADNNVMQVASGDNAMNKAVLSAMSSFPRFLEHAETESGNWENKTIKVALEGASQIENIWVSDFRSIEDNRYKAKLSNDPVDLPGMKAGDIVEFDVSQIVDWGFVENGKGYGFYSVRAMLPKMGNKQAKGMRDFLSADPLPASW